MRNPKELTTVAREVFSAVPDECMQAAISSMLREPVWSEQALVQSRSWKNALQVRPELEDLELAQEPLSLLEQTFAYKAITESSL